MIPKFRLGDIVQLRKRHPCGEDRWEVLRTGADFRIRCLGCGRMVMISRRKFERAVRRVVGSTVPTPAEPPAEGGSPEGVPS